MNKLFLLVVGVVLAVLMFPALQPLAPNNNLWAADTNTTTFANDFFKSSNLPGGGAWRAIDFASDLMEGVRDTNTYTVPLTDPVFGFAYDEVAFFLTVTGDTTDLAVDAGFLFADPYASGTDLHTGVSYTNLGTDSTTWANIGVGEATFVQEVTVSANSSRYLIIRIISDSDGDGLSGASAVSALTITPAVFMRKTY